MSQTESSPPAATQSAEPKRSSPIRLIVLLGILGILLAAFLVDMFVMYDSVNAAAARLQAASDETAGRSVKDSEEQQLTREGVVKAIGFEPTNNKVENGQLKEYYRWWGALPLQRRFIEVIYADQEGKHFVSYEISNRDIMGRDVDPDVAKPGQQTPAGDPEAPVPSAPTGPAAPMPGLEVMPPAGKGEDDAGESTPDKEESPSITPAEDADKPGEDADKDDDSTEE